MACNTRDNAFDSPRCRGQEALVRTWRRMIGIGEKRGVLPMIQVSELRLTWSGASALKSHHNPPWPAPSFLRFHSPIGQPIRMATSDSPEFLRRIEILEEPSEEQIQNLLEIETSDHTEAPKPQNEQHGLFRLNSSTSQSSDSPRDACKLDIIAVHGLGGDVYRTWQHENGFNWLQHLEEELPGIRVYSYGYDSGVAFSSGTASLTEYARHLLSLVKMTRSSEKASPASGLIERMTDK